MTCYTDEGERYAVTAVECVGLNEEEFVNFGTYEIDEQTDTVCHHIKGSVFPNWIGTV